MRDEKGSVPIRYWILWWSLIVVADFVFYLLLTPIWIGLLNYHFLFTKDDEFRQALTNTIYFVVFGVPAQLVTAVSKLLNEVPPTHK